MYHPTYATPSPGYPAYDYIRTPPVSPSPAGTYGYYSARGYSSTSPKKPHHTRRASNDVPIFTYATPRHQGYQGGAYAGPRYSSQYYSTPRRDPDYVSGFGRSPQYSSGRHYNAAGPGTMPYEQRASGDSKRRHPSSRYVHTVVVDDDEYGYYEKAPPPYEEKRYNRSYYNSHDGWYGGADYNDYYDQVPIYTEAETTPQRSRARRASHTARPATTPPKPRPSPEKKSSPKATDEDAHRAGIPAGYSFKNWDPSEEPILLLGSVFDANSLGKWIYDWTVFHHGPTTPMSEVAGELWLLLIQLAGKMKRADDSMPKIRRKDNKEMVEDFVESGERLWIRFAKLLKVCEDYMWRAAKREAGDKKPVSMGKNAGCEFVDTIFGRDRQLEMTEKLMTGMRLWGMRFDANCEEILRHPSA